MDFKLSEEQQLLHNTMRRWAQNVFGGLVQLEAARSQPWGFSAANWAELAELGLLSLPFAKADGGLGGGPTELMIVMAELGRALAPEPYLASTILAGGALSFAGSDAQRAAMMPRLMEGGLRLAFAHDEVQARYDLYDVATIASASEGGFCLNGRKALVLNGDGADMLVVSARTSGAPRDEAGISLFLVPADADGVDIATFRTHDGGRAADVQLSNVFVASSEILGPVGSALPVIERVAQNAIAALCAEAVGVIEALCELTVEHLKTRRQFGIAIGSFQILQHKVVDMFVALEQARSMALYAAMMLQEDNTQERRIALSAAKVQINTSARFVGQTAVQLHGGIGMTMEYMGAQYFRRLAMIERMFGDTPYHLHHVMTGGGLVNAS